MPTGTECCFQKLNWAQKITIQDVPPTKAAQTVIKFNHASLLLAKWCSPSVGLSYLKLGWNLQLPGPPWNVHQCTPLNFGGTSKVEKISACATSKENIEPKTQSNLVRATQKLGFEHGRLFFHSSKCKTSAPLTSTSKTQRLWVCFTRNCLFCSTDFLAITIVFFDCKRNTLWIQA